MGFDYQQFRNWGESRSKVKPDPDKNLEATLAEKLVTIRYLDDLSQEELARKVGTTQSVIARLESGRHTPSIRFLKNLAEALEMDLSIEFR